MNSEKLYSLDKLNEMSGNNPQFIEKMIRLFLEIMPELIANMESGWSERNFKLIYQSAHKAKPTIDLMGITTLHTTIRDLEQKALKEVYLDQIPSLIAEVKEVLLKVINQLQSR